MEKYFVYVLKSKSVDRFYTGFTENLSKRIKEHNYGKVKSTKAYLPYELVYYETFENKTEARKRELFFKTGIGRKIVKELITNFQRRGGRAV